MNISNKSSYLLKQWYHLKSKLILKSLMVGVITGFIIVAYRLLIDLLSNNIQNLFNKAKYNFSYLFLGFILLILIATFINFLIKKEPLIKGSGIPQSTGYILRLLPMNTKSILPLKFIGSILSIGCGLSLGREGPSIQLGSNIGKSFHEITNSSAVEEKFLITAGASAGIAAAFNAPFAGVIFALEEIHKNFSPIVLLSCLSCAVGADYVSEYFFHMDTVFHLGEVFRLPLNYYPHLIFLGILCGIVGVCFNFFLIYFLDLYKQKNFVPDKLKIYIPFLMSGVLMIYFPLILRGGHEIIDELTHMRYSILFILILFLGKFFFTMICYGSGAPGGIFLPMLVLGGLLGAFYAQIVQVILPFDSIYMTNMIIFGMAATFTAIVRSPITGCILICEMTGSFNHFLAVTIVSLVAYIIADSFKSEPIYESLLEGIINTCKTKFSPNNSKKVLIESCVCMHSKFEGKCIKEIEFPSHSLIVGIRKGNEEKIVKGNTKIKVGDCLIILTNEINACSIYKFLEENAQKEYKIV